MLMLSQVHFCLIASSKKVWKWIRSHTWWG